MSAFVDPMHRGVAATQGDASGWLPLSRRR